MAGLFDDMPDDWESKHKMSPEEFEETTNYLKNHPLFMKEIPKNIEDYPDLLALQNLFHDDEPENIARSYKEKGNQHYKKGEGKRYFIRQAIDAYTEGIDAGGKEKDVNAQLYNNRALMHMKLSLYLESFQVSSMHQNENKLNLKQQNVFQAFFLSNISILKWFGYFGIALENYGKAIDDCKRAIQQDEEFIKAYFRKAQIESLLRRYDQSLLTSLIGLKFEPTNKELLAIKKDSEKQIEVEKKRREKITEHKQAQDLELHNECKKRRIYLGKKVMDFPDSCKQSVYLDEQKILHIPIFVHYPEFSQMDYIDDTREKDCLSDHLVTVFQDKLPWDKENYYNMDNIEVYIEFNQTKALYSPSDLKTWPAAQGFKKIDTLLTLSQIFSIRGYVLPSVAELTIVSKVSPFYKVFQEQYDFV